MTDKPMVRARSRTAPNPSTDPADAEQPKNEAPKAAAPSAGALGSPRRSRVAMATGSGEDIEASNAAGGDDDWMKSGDDGAAVADRVRRERAQQEAEKAAQPVRAMRFKLAHDVKDVNGNYTGYGEVADVVILDAKPGPRFWEHRVPNPRTGFYTNFEQCPHEWDNCPLCPPEGEKSPYFVMILTVIDMRPFTDREGTTWEATRKLLPVKIEQQGFFDDLYREHGTLRGIRLIMNRDGGRMSAEIGNNIQFYGIHTEEEMIDFCKQNGLWEEYKQPTGRVVWSEGEFIQPYVYSKQFEKPSGKKLRDKYRAQETTGQSHIGGEDRRGDGWRRGTEPGRAAGTGNRPGGGMANRQASSRRVNLNDDRGGPGNNTSQTLDDEIPF